MDDAFRRRPGPLVGTLNRRRLLRRSLALGGGAFATSAVARRSAGKPKLSAPDAGLLLDGANPDRFPFDEGVNGAIACIALLP